MMFSRYLSKFDYLFKYNSTNCCGFGSNIAVTCAKRTIMATAKQQKDHLERTDHLDRNKAISRATVSQSRMISPTVKLLTMNVQEKELSFKAGQWVDFHILNMETVGGFSMCSSPQRLVEEGTLDLAIKYSDHPPAYWVHTQCEVGSVVDIQVGGEFLLDLDKEVNADSTPMEHLILIAGGVGINPILSMLLYAARHPNTPLKTITLLYSSRSKEELLFRDILKELYHAVQSKVKLQIQLFVTREIVDKSDDDDDIFIKGGRITHGVIEEFLGPEKSEMPGTHAYICGPSHMIDTVDTYLMHIGLSKDNIHYEKWW